MANLTRQDIEGYVGKRVSILTRPIPGRRADYLTAPYTVGGVLSRVDDSSLWFDETVTLMGGSEGVRKGIIGDIPFRAVRSIDVLVDAR